MIENKKIIERAKESLSFIEQLQNQIQLCREALSNPRMPLTPRVEALESLLWAKLKEDKDYQGKKKEIETWLQDKKQGLQNYGPDATKKALFSRQGAKEQFKAIMIFIDKKGYMPIE